MSVSICLISPTSRAPFSRPLRISIYSPCAAGGSTKLSSSDPFAKPTIDPKFMSTTFDIFAMREAVKAVQRFTSASPWKDYIIAPFLAAFASATTDASIESYVRGNAGTLFHPVGTASMSPKGAKWGVVDPDLKVKGVEGLRIADGSVIVRHDFVRNGCI